MGKRRFAILAAVALTFCMSTNCFAAEYYLEDGNISIHTDGTTQTVTQAGNAMEDSNPIIKSREPATATSNKIEISADQDTVANVVIEDVNILVPEGEKGSCIDVKGDSEVLITVKGINSVVSQNGKAAVHVADGILGIIGDGTLNVTTYGVIDPEDSVHMLEGAAIGTDSEEDLNGAIVIGGDTEVNALVDADETKLYENEGAAIGTGYGGSIAKDASISIIDHAVVVAQTRDDGAGIGSGVDGNVDGSIIIKDESDVTGFSKEDGAGIGSGESGTFGKDALIWITGKAKVNGAGNDDGTGIGSGRKGELHGKILIDGESNVKASGESEGAGIGAGESADAYETAQIIIGGKAKVVSKGFNFATGIGAGEGVTFEGDIIIQDEADVTAVGSSYSAALGTDEPGEYIGSIQILGNSKLTTGHMDQYGDMVFDPTDPGMIGGGSFDESGDGYSSDMDMVIGQGVTINGIMANSVENVTNILNTYTDGVVIDADNFSQEEKPVDLKTFEPKLEQAKLPGADNKPEIDPVDPEVPVEPTDPEKPEVPVEPTDPEKPVKPAEPVVPAKPATPSTSVTPAVKTDVTSNTVQTGDQANLTLWVSMIALACVGILGAKKAYK